MRGVTGLCVWFVLAVGTAAQDPNQPPERYKIEVNPRAYPQAMPEQTLQSVVKAINDRDLNYLLAHLTDPAYVDARVEENRKRLSGGSEESRTLLAFDALVKQIDRHLRDDPSLVQELRRLAREGQWENAGDTASAKLPDVVSRRAYFKKIGDRWFLENRRK